MTAADAIDGLQQLTPQQAIGVLERACQPVTASADRVDGRAEAVAVGGIVAGGPPGSPTVIGPDDGPREPLPELPAQLRGRVGRALDGVVGDGSDLAVG
ncbi:hypothetical protein [Streptomyces sp. MBT33]|uniref:hypothetical protein n=1 Tax=Streptomyces sp. MBT33 TaxID=1488363 RepID=UPI00190969AD|nr:hypothetical protein [Streptomyces sp. MBT33]MBK3644766.1 hypothetical protein [Streptomyces sp. MBT33]